MEVLIMQTINVFIIFLISILVLVICAEKKPPSAKSEFQSSKNKVRIKTPGSSPNIHPQLVKPPPPGEIVPKTGNEPDDGDDDVKFELNIKKTEEKKNEFDDDEENPLAKFPAKQRQNSKKKYAPKKRPSGVSMIKGVKNAKNPESPFLAPNEKQIGVFSCYQFEPTAVPATPGTNNQTVKKDPTTIKVEVNAGANAEVNAKAKTPKALTVKDNTISMFSEEKLKTKTCDSKEQEKTVEKLEKTQH